MLSKYYNIVNSATTDITPENIKTLVLIHMSTQCYNPSIKDVYSGSRGVS